MIYVLCGTDLSPEHEKKIKQMKVSKAAIIMVIKEKETYGVWRDKKEALESENP